MPEPDDEMITFRISPRDRASIQRLVEQGEFRNRSDFLRYAVRTTLDNVGERNRARVNFELEGVDLPNANATAAANRPRPRNNRKGVGL